MAVTQYIIGLVLLGLLQFGLVVAGKMHAKRKGAALAPELSPLARRSERRWAGSYYAAFLVLVVLFLLTLWWAARVTWHMGIGWQLAFLLMGVAAGYSLPAPTEKKFWWWLVEWAVLLAAIAMLLHVVHIRHYLPFIPVVTSPIHF